MKALTLTLVAPATYALKQIAQDMPSVSVVVVQVEPRSPANMTLLRANASMCVSRFRN
jgi:hypothetical protein